MAKFKDKNEREWTIELDPLLIEEVRKDQKVDLCDIDTVGEKLADPPTLFYVLWTLCREEAESKGLDAKQFAKALAGDPLHQAAEALTEAISDFFPARRRSLLRALTDKNTELTTLAEQQVLAKINDPALKERTLQALEKRIEEELQKALTRFESAGD